MFFLSSKKKRLQSLLDKAAAGRKLTKREAQELYELASQQQRKKNPRAFTLEEMTFYDELFGD